ncbi:DUF3040 domain-containing protein [Nonomuraea sp. NPDC050310]|uniref:DUF3040 domain-containing protein n=1 Tax=unclassified Nonomuraea TaxID=2593643 RepID=UPI0033F5DEDA
MALSARDQSVLEAIAGQLRADDPAFARRFSEHGDGEVTSERIVSSRELWPVALIVVCLAVFAAAMIVAGSPESLPHVVTR